MKKCPKCGEEYADTTIKCNICNVILPVNKVANRTKKICPSCRNIYIGKDKCPECNTILSENLNAYVPAEYAYHSDGPGVFLSVLSGLIPIAGFIVGIAYIISNNEEKGKPLIITSVIAFFIYLILLLMAM